MYSLGGYSRMHHSVSRRLVINVLVELAPIFDKMLLQIVSIWNSSTVNASLQHLYISCRLHWDQGNWVTTSVVRKNLMYLRTRTTQCHELGERAHCPVTTWRTLSVAQVHNLTLSVLETCFVQWKALNFYVFLHVMNCVCDWNWQWQ